MIKLLGIPRFEQYVLNMALVHLCDREGYVGQLIRQSNANADSDEPTQDPWAVLHLPIGHKFPVNG